MLKKKWPKTGFKKPKGLIGIGGLRNFFGWKTQCQSQAFLKAMVPQVNQEVNKIP